jgi:hypothetical protein
VMLPAFETENGKGGIKETYGKVGIKETYRQER